MICFILGCLVILQVWCYRKSLEVAIAVIDATADFFVANKRVLVVSFMYFVLACVVFDLFMIAELALMGLHGFKKGEFP